MPVGQKEEDCDKKKENKENKKTLSAVRETATRSLLWIKGAGRMTGRNGESRKMKGGSEHEQTEERGTVKIYKDRLCTDAVGGKQGSVKRQAHR